jgi:hypothetical protein
MPGRIWIGSCVGVLLAVAIACSPSAQNPASPTTLLPAGTGAAADGSTLKVPAPTQISPIGDTRIDSRRPTFVFRNVAGKYVGATFSYELELIGPGNAVVDRITVAQASGTQTQYAYGTNLERDTPYSWRVRATLSPYFGPWSPTSGFVTIREPRTPDPPPGQRLPLPNGLPILLAVSAQLPPTDANACPDEYPATGWQWVDRVVAALRETDTRWGYNWKRRIVGSLSTDVINYHYGPGPDEGSFEVWTVKILRCQGDGHPPVQWIDITNPDGPGAMWTCARCPQT